MKISIIGQSYFGRDVYEALKEHHEVAAVFTVPDGPNEDPLATAANADGVPVHKLKTWRIKDAGGKRVVNPEILALFRSYGVDLNVMAFVSQFVPLEICNAPVHKSLCFHPSLLPRGRGASALSWTLIKGDPVGGFSLFVPDDGLDTGPIVYQERVDVDVNDTLNTFYQDKIYPRGVESFAKVLAKYEQGCASFLMQENLPGATYDPMLTLKKNAAYSEIDWNAESGTIHNLIRGCDAVPGAHCVIDGEHIRFFGSAKLDEEVVKKDDARSVPDTDGKVFVQDGGMYYGACYSVSKLQLVDTGKFVKAGRYFERHEAVQVVTLDLSAAEVALVDKVRACWATILNGDVDESTDFFGHGASSLDVSRLVDMLDHVVEPDVLFEHSTFQAFANAVVLGVRDQAPVAVDYVSYEVCGKMLQFPNQPFVGGVFVSTEETVDNVSPVDENVICPVYLANEQHVEAAVEAGNAVFPKWRDTNARKRGDLLYALAAKMAEHADTLAWLESVDSGAVVSLAKKTHVGMSIQAFKYYAGLADKVCGTTVPINHAKPAFNTCFTVKEPLGTVGIIVPWNYPLMMLAWKTAAALCAGNCVVIKPATVTPLTALYWADLVRQVGFPKGVVSVLPGRGRVVGKALALSDGVAKIGFTGSTPVGKTIMGYCASANVLKKVSLELGGKSALIVDQHYDVDQAVAVAMQASFFNKGENCIAAGRIFVHEKVHDAFVAKVQAKTDAMVVGSPYDAATEHGPQNHLAHLEKLLDYVAQTTASGAKLVCGGTRVNRVGYYLAPTVFTGVQDGTFPATVESFGPIMLVSSFATVDEAVERANATAFGLAGGVLSNDVSTCLKVARNLHCGTCFVNCYNKTDVAAPFGGFGNSGFGKDLGQNALDEYTQVKTVTMQY